MIHRLIKYAVVFLVLTIGFDYGKHWLLKRVIENDIKGSAGLVTVDAVSVRAWPLLQNHIVLTNFRVHTEGLPGKTTEIHLRQGWKDWRLAHIKAIDIAVAETAFIQEAQGTLDTRDLNTQVNVLDLTLSKLKIKLPLITFTGTQANFDFRYHMNDHRLDLKVNAPDLAFESGAHFGLIGNGHIDTQPSINGKVDLQIKNLDKMLQELANAKIVDGEKAKYLMAGSDFFGKIGMHDLSLPLNIEQGNVYLGPLWLMKVGK